MPRRARAASPALAAEIGDGRSPEEVADGFIKIAVENMANAIKKISVQRGYDVTRYALNCFGGAGGQHACLVADALGMTTVLIHPFSSLLSAYGMGPRRHPRHAPAGDRGAARRRGWPRSARSAALGGRRERRGRAGQGVPRATSRSTCARTSATPAPTPRWWCRRPGSPGGGDARAPSRRSAFERPRKSRFGFIDERRSWWSKACRSRRSAAAQTVRRAGPAADAREPAPARRTRFFSRRRAGTTPPSSPRAARARPARARPRHRHRAAPDRRGRARLAGRDHGEEPPGAHARRAAQARKRAIGTAAPIRSCSRCSTTCSCRSPSRWACRCRTPPIRSTSRSGSTSPARCSTPTARWSPTRRTCRCISAPWTARSRPSSARTGPDRARRRLRASTRPTTAAPICPTSPWCTPVFDEAEPRDPVLGRLARPPRRRRRHRARLDVAARDHHRGGRRLYRQLQAGRPRPLPRAGALRPAHRRHIPGPQPAAERQRPQGADRRQREGRAGAAQDGGAVRPPTWCRPTCSTCRTTPPRACAA